MTTDKKRRRRAINHGVNLKASSRAAADFPPHKIGFGKQLAMKCAPGAPNAEPTSVSSICSKWRM